MDENRIVELLTRKIAGEASPDELGELSYLLKKHPDSVYYEALLEQVWELGEREPDENLSEVYQSHKLKFKDDLHFSKTSIGLRRFFSKPVLFAVLFTCSFFAASYFILNKYDQRIPKERISILAGRGVRKEITLPDGTLVRLNSDSRISYDPDMLDKDTREVNLSGEAFFNVAHDDEQSFIVKTKKVAVKVLGTEFNIKEYADENKSETTLLKGSIELVINDRLDQKFLLKPSEKFALVGRGTSATRTAKSSVLTIEHISPIKLGNKEYIEETSWAENKLVFQNEAFEVLIPKLERWYNVRIELTDQKIKSFRFTGVFIDENIVDALEAMKLIKSFNYKLTANEIKIY